MFGSTETSIVHIRRRGVINLRYLMGLTVSFLLIIYGFWKLNNFFEPKVGPVGNGPSDTIINLVWIIFSANMLLGFGGIVFFTYLIFKKKK